MVSRMARFPITVVVPCLNEADNVEHVYREIIDTLGDRDDALELLFVDDGSTDDTLARIRDLAAIDPRVQYVSFTRNFGLEAAFTAGFRHARHPWVLQLDADLQFPPAEALKLIARAEEGYDAVFGTRVNRQDHWIRRFSSAAHEFIACRLLRIELPSGGTSFRLVRTELARQVVNLELGTPYFLATLPRLTNSWTTVEVAHRPRLHGAPKVTFRGLARHAMDLFFGHSTRPIGFAGLLSLIGAGLAILAVVGAVTGIGRAATALLALALATGLLALAVTTRYLVHIARGQPGLPRYLIREASVTVTEKETL
jgi:glycosyltransferase involved in cell wall biosynthesis